jgi:1-deoxy-D-xylulose-5-phosphate synthase
LVGADGATHAGNYDLAYLRCIPNMVVMAASDENECRQMLSTAYHYPGPAAVRYPRGAGIGAKVQPTLDTLPLGKAELKRQGQEIVIFAFGSMLHPALQAAEKLNATVINMRFIKPLDQAMVIEMANSHTMLVSIEEGCIMGGAGSAVAEALAQAGIAKPLLILGLPDQFIDHGDPALLLAQCGLHPEGIEASIRARFALSPQ